MEPNLSAKNPKKMAKTPKARLPMNEVREPMVARSPSVNSVCISLLLATSVTPKRSDEEDMRMGEKTLAISKEMTSVTRLYTLSISRSFSAPYFLISLPLNQ